MTSRTNNSSVFALTMGDPAGIGPWVAAKLWSERKERNLPAFCWFGDPKLMSGVIPVTVVSSREEILKTFDESLPVFPCECKVQPKLGVYSPENAHACIQSIRLATEFVQKGECDGIVTSPISKEIFRDENLGFSGHTDFIASLCGVQGQEVMMLANPHLKVVLGTVHIPLKDVVSSVKREQLLKVALVTQKALKEDFGISHPKIAVAGLNPHAGENGMLGGEEKSLIAPAIEDMKKAGVTVSGPYAADTMFMPQIRETYDAALCMYHDQGLIPLKTLDMEKGVNITLGLPIVRTSPDHGTAYDKATAPGKQSNISIESTVQALLEAQAIDNNRKKHQG